MPNLPRLLVLSSTYPRWSNDTEPRFVHELSRRLTKYFEVHVLTPHSPGAERSEILDKVIIHRYRYAPETLECLVHNGGILNNLRTKPINWLLLFFFLASQLITTIYLLFRLKPDAVHAHWIIPQGFIAAIASVFYRKKFRFIITSHGTDTNSFRTSIFKWIKTFTANKADKILVVSNALKDTFLHDTMISEEKTNVLSMGVNLEHFTPDENYLRNSQQLLFVGRFVESKGLPYLIDALHLISQQKPDVKLILVGFGPEENTIREKVSSLGLENNIVFHGPATQISLPNLYRESTILIAPFSDAEGLGLVLVEAAGCLCPVVCSDMAGTRDIVIDGITGLTVEPKNHIALSTAILKLLDQKELRDKLAVNARKYVLKRYDWKNVAKKHAAILLDTNISEI